MIVNYGDYLVKIGPAGQHELLGKDTLNWPFYNIVREYNGKVYMANGDGLFLLGEGHQKSLFNGVPDKKMLSFFIDSKGRTWVYFYKRGMLVSSPGNTELFDQQVLSSDELVSQVFEDKLGIIWIASSVGLLRAEPRHYMLYDSLDHHKLKTVRNILNLPGRGVIAASELNGLLTFDDEAKKLAFKAESDSRKSFDGSIIDGYCIDSANRAWMVSRSGKLFTLEEDRLTEIHEGSMGGYGGFFDITCNPRSGIMYVTSDTLYEGRGSSFSKFTASNTGGLITFPVKVKSFSNGVTLVGTRHNGILMIDSLRRVQSYSMILDIPVNSNLVDFYDQGDDRFWITYSGGMKRYKWNKQQIPVEELSISEANGLPNNAVYSMAFEKNGRIWALTASGIVTIQPGRTGKDLFIRKWNEADGIMPENLRGGHIVKDDQGNIWVQLIDRVYYFDAKQIQLQREVPNIVITSVQLRLQETDWTKYTDSLHGYLQIPFNPVLPAGMNSLGIFYKGISFRDYSGLEYSYRLNGDSSSWSPGQKNGFISFVGLPPGKYQFLVRVKDSNAGWSNPAEFTFTILKPFWQQWWFIMLMLLLIGYLVFALFQFRLHEKLVVLNVRQKLHRDLHDDIGATLSSIKVYTEVLQDDPGNSIITGLIRENAEDMISQLELIAWATNPQNDTFKKLCELMRKYAIPACYAKKIEFNFRSESISSNLIIPGNVRKNLFLVFKEAVNNIIKYSEATACASEMVIMNHKFILEISDNGKGMDVAGREHGYGMQNMAKRAEELKGKLEVASSPGNGVTIRMIIPFPFKIPYTWDEKGKEYQ